MEAYRQGELLFVKREIKDLAALKKTLAGGKQTTVIAEGEATGHKHELTDPATATVIEVDSWGTWIDGYAPRHENFEKVLHTETGTVIKHPDHNDLQLPAGTFFIRSEREYDEEMHRRVID